MSDEAAASTNGNRSGTAPTDARPGMRKSQWPDVYKISFDDLIEVTAAGINDFRAAPKYGLFFGGMYAVVGWVLLIMLWFFELHYLVYPIAMGFALIAPFASVGFYSVSDFLEQGKPLSWGAVFDAIRQGSKRDLRWMALITGFTFFMWIDYAVIIFLSFMGFEALGPQAFDLIFTTSQGWMFLLAGHLAGAIVAIIVFSISVTSVRLVFANTVTMLGWCLFITVLTGLSLLSVFAGLFIMLPVLGHASWHLYRRAVGPQPVKV
jgi:uncharacterized membrane protein